jgi:hypothetical protein
LFFPGSRYQKTSTYTITRADGTSIAVAKLPLPLTEPLIGFHRRQRSERLDLLAYHFLSDATTFWRLCDVNNSVVPDALGAADLVGIPGRSL